MNDVLKTVLSLSLSGSIIAIILFAVKPFLKNKISKTWQYYIWIIIILRLLIPFTSEISVLNGLFNSTEINDIIPIENVSPSYQMNSISPNNQIANEKPLNETANENFLDEKEMTQNTIENDTVNENISSTKTFDGYLTDIQENGWLVWLFISATLLFKKIISYHVYVRYIKLNRQLLTDESIIAIYDEVSDQAGIKRKIGIYSYKMINSPMLIGFVKPYILLPETILKTTDGLRYILLHELTHYRRLDFLYKWFVQIAVCVHFFNPIVYFVRKSINKACEFSCDEMVIKKLDEQSKKAYGTALIDALELSVGYNQHAISFMLCEDVKIIKERLGAIMKYKKGNKFIVVVTMFLTVAISFGAIFTGAYAATNAPKPSKDKVAAKDEKVDKNISDYSQYGISYKNTGGYFYNEQRIRLFVDERADGSFKMCFTDKLGTIDLQTTKNNVGAITGITNMPQAKAHGMLVGQKLINNDEVNQQIIKKEENNQQSSMDNLLMNDLSPYRLSKDQLTDNLKSWINECDKKHDLYVTSKNSRWYVYCNSIPNDYAWKIDTNTANGVIVNLYDIGTKGDGYALLSIPNYDNIQVFYKEKKVQFTDDSKATDSNENKTDFDNDDFIMKLYQTNAYTADSYNETIKEQEASLQFTNFTGSKTFYEINFDRDTTVGFSISADVKYLSDNDGEYKITFITENNQILMSASTYDWFELSRPIDFPKGRTRLALIGEQISGNCKISLSPESYISRSDSLIQNFEKYKSYGVTYNAEQDAVYYNGEKVKLFVDFKAYKAKDMTYAFDLCYRDSTANSALYLEAVKDDNGNIKGIQKLNNEIALDILGKKSELSKNNNPLQKESAEIKTASIMGENWYLIETEAQLRSIGSKEYPLSAKYMLNANIKLSKTEDWTPLGSFDVPFTGAFNGNGFEIIDLTIKDPKVKVIGMFAYVQNAEIGNIILRNPDIESAFQKGDSIAPIIVFGLGGNEIYGNQIIGNVSKQNNDTSNNNLLMDEFSPYRLSKTS